jgi:predicted phosphodiesterase
MRIVCISDTHGRHRDLEIPECDLLLHAGDITGRGEPFILRDFNAWLAGLPASHKVVIAGNHDETLERNRHWARNMLSNATYLDREATEIEGVRIFGFPLTPRYGSWSFMAHHAVFLIRIERASPVGATTCWRFCR